MTYLQNRLIEDTDFNNFRNTLNNIWSTGTGNSGYGQTAIGAVANNDLVTATNYWRKLTDNITSVANHTGTFIASMTPAPNTNGKIIYLQNISTNLTTINTNRLNAISQGSTSTTVATSTSTWNNTMTMTFTVTFSSNNAARYFFNAGGQLGLNFSHPNSTNINGLIQDICNETGTIWLSSPTSGTVSLAGVNYNGVTKVGGTVSARQTLNTNFGFYALTNVDTQILEQRGDSPSAYSSYFNSFLRISASYNNAGIITFTCLFDQVPNGATVASGTTGTLTVRPPSTTYITNTWGTPTVTSNVTYSTVVQTVYNTPGTYSYTVPLTSSQLLISYPTSTGISSSTINVTPGQTYTVTIGNFGSGSSFGTLTALTVAAYTRPVLQFAGNVDGTLYIDYSTIGSTSATYTGAGTSGTLAAGASAAGLTYIESSELFHGDLYATVTLNRISSSQILYSYRVAITSVTGRGTVSITRQPTTANNNIGQVYFIDPFASEGYYTLTVSVQQIVGFTILPN